MRHNNIERVHRAIRIAKVLAIVGGLLFFIRAYSGSQDPLTVFPFGILSFISAIFIVYMNSKYLYETAFEPSKYPLAGAKRYASTQDRRSTVIPSIKEKIKQDGFHYGGAIDNPFSSVMEMYRKENGHKDELIFFIHTEAISQELLLEHQFFFFRFLTTHSSEASKQWLWRTRTVIIVERMSPALLVLLSSWIMYLAFLGQNAGFAPRMYALVLDEAKVYTKNTIPIVRDRHMENLENYLLVPREQKPEVVWMDWTDVYFFDWREKNPQKAFRYDAAITDKSTFMDNVRDTLLSANYILRGSISNPHGASIEVYNLIKELEEVTVVLIVAETINTGLFMEHRSLLSLFMEKQESAAQKRWQEGIRFVIGVQRMTSELQILLSSHLEFRKPKFYYEKPNSEEVPQVFALVEEEQSIYTMSYTPGVFENEIHKWMERHIPGIDRRNPEIVWKGLDWEDLESLPMSKNEMILEVHKALNLSREETPAMGKDDDTIRNEQ
jgi:hypothetical protein